MSKKTGSILSAVIVMMLCLCLIVGATFALFGKQSAVDIAVTSGDIAVNAEASGLVLYSAQADPNGPLTDEAGNKYSYGRREDGTFVNGGTAQLSGGTFFISPRSGCSSFLIRVTIVWYGLSGRSPAGSWRPWPLRWVRRGAGRRGRAGRVL